jgi:hypothetical protein
MSGRNQDVLVTRGSMAAYLPSAAIYFSLALFPQWWSAEARIQLLFQFYIVELCGGMMVGTLGRLVLESSPWLVRFGAGLIMVMCLAGVVVIGWVTQSVALAALVAVPLVPRVYAAVKLVSGGRLMGGMMLREGALSLAGCMLIGISYAFLMSAGPDDPPNSRTVPPPIGYTGTVMALYYLVMGYYAGKREGLEAWVQPERGA